MFKQFVKKIEEVHRPVELLNEPETTICSKSPKFTVGIVGGGFVGQATALFACKEVEVCIYDLDASKCRPSNMTLEGLAYCDLVFVCVPTPSNADGSCHTKIVEKVIRDVRVKCGDVPIIVRSTVPVGFCRKMNVSFCPEFLTEQNWKKDFVFASHWILGVNDNTEVTGKVVRLLLLARSNDAIHCDKIEVCSTDEAETIKYFRNCFLATKVAFCNEMAEFCRTRNIDYGRIASVACSDSRIGMSHTLVPGPDGQYGYGGTCFPKDMNSFMHQQMNVGLTSYIIASAINRNEQHDRPDKDWKYKEQYRGRAIVYE